MPCWIRYPFAALVGHRAEKHALLLLAVEPRLRGVLIATRSGSAQSTLARAFGSLLRSEDKRAGLHASLSTGVEADTVHLPLGITEDGLLGGLELEQTLATGKRQVATGLLARANGRVLFVDDMNLLDSSTAAHIAQALESRKVHTEREGVSAVNNADFVFLGTFNPAEGEPSALLRDRVALIVNSRAQCSTDETVEMINRVFRFENDPSGFADDFAFETAVIKSAIEAARARLPRVGVSKVQVRQIALVAMKLGVEGNRADVFALRAARANAALAGRDAVNEDDLIVAIQLVLAPRAITLPSSREEQEREHQPSQPESSDESIAPESHERERDPLPGSIEDLLIHATDARVPEDALSASQRTAQPSRIGKRLKALAATRGRYVHSATQRTRNGRVAIDATLRAAAPFQLRRRAQSDLSIQRPAERDTPTGSLTNVAARRVKIHSEDLRFKEVKHRSGILFILAVDASGSMAFNRMAQAKGALIRLLQQAYFHRDKVALISFRGPGAEVLLAPTRSVELAKRLVDALPAGGGTPLSAGIVKAIELARFARFRGTSQATLLLFTDGRANIGLGDGQASRTKSTIREELGQLGALLGSEEITTVIVDTKPRFVSSGEGNILARMLGARYVYLPGSDAEMVYKAIGSGARQRDDKRTIDG